MAPSELDLVRKRLGERYQIERELGRGGMGTVYLARDVRLDRLVALKVLPAESVSDAAVRERFARETRTAASFSHPNIVPVHAVEEGEGLFAYAMGYVEGESLTERVQRAGPLGQRDLVRLLQDVGYALAYAHGRGVVHRDLKPDNVMIERATGRALLTDFGIARAIAAVSASARPGLTRVGEVVGTPEYMSPEQATADTLDGRSDLYALGLVAHFAATGRTAMDADTPRAVMMRQLTETPAPLAALRPDLPTALTAAIDRCVKKEPSDRFQRAEDLVDAIDEAQLAAPEIPLAIRGLLQELATLVLVLAFVLVISVLVVRDAPAFLPFYVRGLPATLFLAIGVGRIWQTLSMVRRLAAAGYTLDDILRGLRAVVNEQQAVREELRLDTRLRARRRRTIRMALLAFPIGVVAFYFAIVAFAPGPQPPKADLVQEVEGVRTELSADSVARPKPIPPPGEKRGAVLTLISFSLIGISLVSLSRSPFRMPVGEWVFRQVFLRAPGRAFLSIGTRAARGYAAEVHGRTITPARAVTARAPSQSMTSKTTATPLTLDALDARLRSLEQWRESSSEL